jgi:hypothetical protein
MKKILFISLVIIILLGTTSAVLAKNNDPDKKPNTGFDEFGYNYNAFMFNGRYCDYDRVLGGDYCEYNLIMKWSPEWLARVDSNDDGKLDRGYADCRGEGYNPNLTMSDCPGAWLTNHMRGEYTGAEGQTCKYLDFSKMVAVPQDAVLDSEVWYTADGEAIGPAIWGTFALVQEVLNDPCGGAQGILEKYPTPSGFGFWK